MKKIVLTILAATLLAAVVLTLSFAALASTAYTEIRTVQDLKSISSGGNYKLMNDLTLTEAVTLPAFSGKFDGNGKTVSGIRAPLFEEVSGTVSNLTLTGEIDISGKTAIAALTNTLAANGVIDSCTVNVTLSGTRPSSAMVVGGIAAYARSNAVIKNSTNQGNITVIGAHDAENDNAMGGIVGRMDSGATVTDCVNLGTIYANGNGNTANFRGAVAGIVGNSNGTTYITNCLNAGDVKAASSKLCIAGILGRTETSDTACPVITNCVNKGTVEKTADLGERPAGIASYVRGGKITWCANLGKVTSNNAEASGIVGYYNGSGAVLNLEYNYNAGDVKSFAIMRVNGTGNLKPVSNFYLSGKSACNTSIGGTIACANQQDLVTKVTAVENALFATDFEGADSINNGYPIAVWQCTHACETVKDADKGEICSKCGKVIAAIDCDHTFGAWTVVDEATATENGEKIRTCSKCGAIDREIIPSTTSVTPVNGVYTVDSSAKLQWVFNGIMAGTVPSDCTVKLACDIDVKGTLTTMTATFTGTFDGNGKTLSGLSNTLFTQFNGIAKDLTLRGDIDYSASSYAFDVARKAASFAHSVKGASLTNVVSYVNVKTSRNDINAGGLVGYANAGNTFKNCVYNGTYTVNWTGDGAGIGGIVGWSNSSGGTTTFDGCTFGGTINVTAGASGKDAAIGGILGNLTNAKVVITNCISNGTITSSVTAGNDYVGGLVGINKNAGSVIESSVNRSALTAKTYAGGIIGGMADNTTVNAVANYGTVTASTKGAIGGTSGGKTFSIQNSADFTEGSTLKLCGTTANLMGSYTADKITDLKQEFTFDGVTYKRYNVGVAEKESGILVPLLHTSDKFTPYISIKDEGASHSIRFVILTRYLAVKSESVTVSINFKDGVGQVIKSKASTLAVTGSDFTLYSAVKADGEKYFAATDLALFGLVITDIPTGVWEKIELTITDTASGASYITPVVFDMSDMQFSPENMPDFSSLGTVSSATYNAGPGLMSDRNTTTNEDSLMKVISNTTAAKLASY
ncbi:MAG: hypothetical protein IJW46_03425, partial [Clostridia bacterium]|nr:hypothetical protein [Clostridia bacterium]